jgi:uncharacterized protein with PIN domain
MITEVEKAVSNRSSCTKCKQFIEAGTLRGIEAKMAFGHQAHSYYCTKCTKTFLQEQIEYSKKLLEQLTA